MLTSQHLLKVELQQDTKASDLEKLVAALVGRLLGVPIAVAGSGFQHGGDAGPAGRQGRRFRLECKKYADTSQLNRRELLGEIDHALARDDALEAWILVTTRSVPEQQAQDVAQHGETLGVPVVILDWKDHELTPLAALCAFDPPLVEALFSKEAAVHARALQPLATQAIANLRRDLQSWCLGFEALRARSHEKLQQIWNSPHASNAELLQDAAGGARRNKIKRTSVHNALNAWWLEQANERAPAAVIGWDGVGKTWATLNWLIESEDQQPIILVVPSSAVAILAGASEASVKQFLADRLYEVSRVRDREHWLRRLDRLLSRPRDEGPAMTVFLDGLNQEPTVAWIPLLKVMQGETFAHRIRVVLSTRTHHFDERLSKLRGLTDRVVPIPVDPYSVEPGGELDQMLAFEGLTQTDLHRDLIDLARRPRLLKLVIRFRDRLVEAGQVTVHRLLWEYGRDTFGERAGRSFSESDWQAWLKEIAQKHREGIREFSLKSLGETASRPDLSPGEVDARLSDIIDGRFATTNLTGALQFTPTVVAHALGAALVWRLSAVTPPAFAVLDAEITEWFDSIAGLDQRAEILRAAVSIVVERGLADSELSGVLVTAWLQTQNIGESHRSEVATLAPNLVSSLLDAVEHSAGAARASARYWAVRALRGVPRTDDAARTKIADRASRWLRIVSRDVDLRPEAADSEKRRAELLKLRIGTDPSGPTTIMGVSLELVDQDDDALQGTVSSLIEGFPAATMLSIFELAAVALAVRGRSACWEELKWLCYLNETDPDEAAAGLRSLSQEVRRRPREAGVHAGLPLRIAGLLLRLTGHASDEDDSVSFDTSFDRSWSYESDYLPNPGRSFFALERRHADAVLHDAELPLHVRIQRTAELWFDPTFEPPAPFVAEVHAAAAQVDVEKLDRTRGRTIEDIRFEELEPVLARCAPELLSDLMRRKLQSVVSCSVEARHCSAHHATDHLILVTEPEVAAARTLRLKQTDANESEESYAASQLLMFEIKDLGAHAQFEALICADLKFILRDFAEVLRRPSADEVDVLVSGYSGGSSKQQQSLLALLSVHPPELSNTAWRWIEAFAKDTDHDLRGLAFRTLGRADPVRFGRSLPAAEDWSWRADANLWVNHYGTHALIEATRAQPFDELVPRLAPWRLLEAARVRGADPAEVRLAAGVFGSVLEADRIEEPDPGSDISIARAEAKSQPFLYSVAPRTNPEETDPATVLMAAFNTDGQLKAYQRAAETARARLDEARKSGASLFLVEMEIADLALALEHAPDLVDRWIEGCRELTVDFRRRVRLAETAFLALCEALLIRDPARGALLWRALRKTVATRYIGAADVDDLIHIVFRAPPSAAIDDLRNELLDLERTHTDATLFDLALAASYNGHTEWLHAAIEADLASPLVWRQRRGLVLSGFTINNTLPVKGAWPEGEIKTSHAEMNRKSARFRAMEASARHWWNAYMAADSTSQAYGAWMLFLRTADRRASLWMYDDTQLTSLDDLMTLKLVHAHLNRSELKRFSKKRGDKLDKNFLGREVAEGLGPWV